MNLEIRNFFFIISKKYILKNITSFAIFIVMVEAVKLKKYRFELHLIDE